MSKLFNSIFLAFENEVLKKQILEHISMKHDSKIVLGNSTLFFDSDNRIVIELPNEDSSGVLNMLVLPVETDYDSLIAYINGDKEASNRFKRLI